MILVIFAMMVIPVFAQFGKVVVFAPKGEKFTLYLGNNKQNSEPESRVEADNPGGPNFRIKVIFETPGMKEISKLVFNKPHGTMYYSVVRNNKGVFVIESAATEWSDEPVTKEAPAAVPPSEKKEKQEKKETPVSSAKDDSEGGCSNPMEQGEFAVALAGIASYPFEGSQLNAAKKMAETHCLYVMQVKEVMYVFNLESSKLSFAKFAYDHTYDQGNYADVGEALNSKKSKDDLSKFIAGKKK